MKRNLWKRTVSLLMSVVMLMSLMVVPAQAEGTGAPADAAGAPVQASQQEAPAAAAAAGTVTGDFAEIVTECPAGVSVEVTGDATGCWKLVQNAEGKRFAKVTDENFDSPKLNITITMPENNRYALVFDYAIDGNSWVDVYDPNWEDTKYLEDDTTKVDIDSTAFKSEAIRLAAGSDTRIFSFTGMHVSHAAYLTNLRIVKIEPAAFFVTLPKGTTATYSANGGKETSFTSDEAVNVMLYDAITVTVTVPDGQCMQGFYRSGDTTRLTYEGSYTFTVTGDSASNKYIVKTLSEEGTNVDGYTAPEGLAVKTYGPHIWTLQDDVLTSGNQRIRGSDSTLAITAAKKGILIFEYKVSSNAFTDGEGYGNVLYYKTDSKPKCHSYGRWDSLIASDAINAEEAVNYSGETGWQSGSVSLEAGQTVYFSFWNDDEVYEFDGEDTAWIKNIYLSSGNVTVSVTANKAEYGTVSGDNLNQPVPEGSKQTYTATAKDGCQFYGWFDGSNKLLSRENTYTCVAKAGITLVAKFGKPAGDYEAWNMDKGELGELATVVQEARSGDTVLLTKNTTLSTDLTIPAGVTLVVPCSAVDTGNRENVPPQGTDTTTTLGRNGTLYRTLTIAEGKTLTVNGTLVINAVVGRQKSGHFDQDINGGYGCVVNNGTIDILPGGAVDAFGLIEGESGNVTVQSGGTLTDLYVVINWRGGSQAGVMYSEKVYPMNEYKADNISSTITVRSGGTYSGFVRMYAGDVYTDARFPQVDNSNGLIRLKDNATLIKKVSTDDGREHYAITGGADFAGSSLNVGISLTTTEFIYPFNGIYDFVLKTGEYAFTEDFKFMPGVTMTTSEADLTVNEGKTVVFYDKFEDVENTDSTQYPANRSAATLKLSDDSSLTVNGTFAGTVVSGHDAKNIRRGANAVFSMTTKEANGYCKDSDGNYRSDPVRELSFQFIPSTFGGYTGGWVNNVYTWEKDKYTITFNTDGGNAITDMTVAWGETLTLPTPTKTGYTFAGWYNDETKFEAKVMPRENLALIAKWTPSTNTAYKVEHYWQNLADDGYTLHETETKTGTTGSATAAAAKSYPGFTAGTVTQPPIAADGSTVVKIYYTRNSYTLTWNFDGGKENATGYTSGTVKFGAAINKPSEDPTKTGYTFAGWDKTIPGTMPAEDVTVKAQWKVVNYSITYDLDGGTVEDNPNSYTVESDFTLKNPTKEGYTFAGWSGTGFSGTEKAVTIKNATGNREYTANWTANQYTITFNTDGGSAVKSITQDYGTKITAPANPAKEGYTFSGWYPAIPTTMPAENMTVKATWKINQYTIAFDTDGGSKIDPITQNYGTAITAPADPTKEGYTFAGWDENIPANMPAKNMTIKAKWTINQYTVTFKNGDEVVKSAEMNYGSTIAEPKAPDKEGYTFKGWQGYTDNMTVPARNVTFTAQWTINQYTLTFKNGETVYKTITQDYGTAITKPADPTKTGYTFAGWDKEIPEAMPAGDMTVTAKWTVNKYTVTFDANGGSACEDITVTYGGKYPTLPAPTKEGYTFEGWFDGETQVKSGDAVTITGNQTLTAHWSINTYTITYQVDGQTVKTESVTYGEDIPAYTYTKTGYDVSAWNSVVPKKMPAENLTFTATTKVHQHSLTYMLDGEMKSQAPVNYGTAVAVQADPTKIGYTFSGWTVSGAEPVDGKFTMPDNDVTITGRFSANTYTVKFNANGGEGSMADQSFTYNAEQALAANGFTRTGWRFTGWKLGNTTYTDGQTVSNLTAEASSIVTLEAQWEHILYTLKFVVDKSGKVYHTEQKYYGDAITPPEAPEKAGYRFDGWDREIPATMPDGDLTIMAKWSSYLDLLIAMGDDFAGEKLGIARGYYQKMNGDQRGEYQSENEGLYNAFVTAVTNASVAALEKNVAGAVVPTNEKLLIEGKQIAELTLNGYDVETRLIAEDYPAVKLTTVDFLTVLFGYGEITSVQVGDQPEVPFKDGTGGKQMELMLAVARQAGVELQDSAHTYISVLDGKSMPVMLNGKTVEGITYSVTYQLSFFNNTHKITWNANGGVGGTTTTGTYGKAITAPTVTRVGYTFAGWDKAIPETMGKTALTFTAKWTANTNTAYKVQHHYETLTDGYDVETVPMTGTTGEQTMAVVKDKAGFTAGTVAQATIAANGSTVVNIYYTRNSYTLTVDADNGTAVSKETYKFGTAIIAPAAPTKTGYTFGGWDKTIPESMPAGDMTVKAQWKINQYTITFDTDGGSEVASITQDYGTAITKPADPTKTGYTFAGWSEEIPDTMPAENMTVKAQWKINQYTITFDTDGGSEVASITQDYGTTIAKPTDPTKTGYTFDGWDKKIPGRMPAENMTVKAQWKINQYTITFDTDGGSEIAPITQGYGTTIAKPTDPTKTGYTFAGWYTDAACTNAWNFGSNMLADHDMTLYARWVRNAVRKATITGSVELGNRPAVGAVVELVLGNRKIAAATTDANGVYSFQTVETGLYNIVAAKDGKTRTALVNVDSAGSYTVDMIVLPGTDVSFEVRIEMPATPPAAGSEPKADVSKTTVGGLDAVADKYAESGKKVALLLTITPKTAEEVDAAVRAAIEERSAGQKIEFVDMTLSKSVDDAPATTISSTGDRLLTINIPFATSGVSVGSMAAYRCIDGKVEILTSTPNADGEFIEVRGGVLVVHTGKPATYAIGYRLRSGSSYGGTYSLTSGDGQNGKAGATLQFGVNSGGTKVSAVYVDGTQLGGGDYTVKGTIVRLKGVYTATLAQGYHFGTVYYDNGYVANFSFTLSGETSPRTADMGIGLYAALALTSLTGMAWVGKRRGSGRES